MNYWERFKDWCKVGDSKKDFFEMWKIESGNMSQVDYFRDQAWEICQLQKKVEELHINLRDFKHEYYKSVSKTQ